MVGEDFDAVDLIRTKRDGGVLSGPQLRWVVDAITTGGIDDAQLGAFAMAVLLNGMTPVETRDLTLAMADSGRRLDFTGLGRPVVDKHSTGGVGDKVTLVLMPLVASLGVGVPQLSGRGLGHTGGTLDKLESIPGWTGRLGVERMRDLVREVGGFVGEAGADLAPADARLYALRDVTGTVESLPLIASSIMSKKIAEGASALVLDVKFGSGAFLPDEHAAGELAATMVELGRAADVDTRTILSDMNAPLGRAVGNAVEVAEAVEVLAGGGPEDVVELVLALAAEMLDAAGRGGEDPAAALADGRAMDTWRRFVAAQGGDPDAPLPAPRETHTVVAEADGVIAAQDARAFGVAAWRLGAGRARAGTPVDHAAGLRLHAKPGETVRAGEPLVTLETSDASRLPRALEALDGAWTLAPVRR